MALSLPGVALQQTHQQLVLTEQEFKAYVQILMVPQTLAIYTSLKHISSTVKHLLRLTSVNTTTTMFGSQRNTLERMALMVFTLTSPTTAATMRLERIAAGTVILGRLIISLERQHSGSQAPQALHLHKLSPSRLLMQQQLLMSFLST